MEVSVEKEKSQRNMARRGSLFVGRAAILSNCRIRAGFSPAFGLSNTGDNKISFSHSRSR